MHAKTACWTLRTKRAAPLILNVEVVEKLKNLHYFPSNTS